jgi:protein-S-isoprenylcysteine O-methyltransferase Ste14
MRSPESTELLIRGASLYVPVSLVVVVALLRRPSRARATGAILATVWNLAALLAINVVAVQVGWWDFEVDHGVVAGVPADLWIGWALLWGAVPILVTTRRLVLAVAALVVVDLVAMPLADPVVVLHSAWLVGEAAAIVVCLVPGLLLGRWTAEDECLRARIVLQFLGFTALAFFVLPTLIFVVTGEGWGPLLERPRWQFLTAGSVLAPLAAMALQAVREFGEAGGTPFPLDPPKRLVASGPYAYVANPMQLSATVLLGAWGLLLASHAVMTVAAMAGIFSAGIAAWTEDRDLTARFGSAWRDYRAEVRTWVPRWRPAGVVPAVVHVAGTCDACSEVGCFIQAQRPRALEVRPAEEFTTAVLTRISYERGDLRATGVAAIGRSLEHVNLAWAAMSWMVRLPGIEWLVQLIADVAGAGPRSIPQRVEA